MGAVTSLLSWKGRRQQKILLVGIDAAGKTTMLYKLKAGEVQVHIPTIGFNVETLEIRGKMSITTMVAWDVGGRDKIRPLWRHYYQDMSGLVFMVDSNDRDRINEARDELQKILSEDELLELPLLVFANKRDMPNAFAMTELIDKLGLHSIRNRAWYIQESVATEGKGIFEGMEWLARQLDRDSSKDRAQPPSRKAELPAKSMPAKPEHADDISTADTEDAAARTEVITTHP